ncbi:DNA-binding transcriptional regulator, FadR family [Actinacidiphila guanduensis]|uniref:DNA-binding transcriptional regulator, FadR family n=1 Tax=Actinacidiphila guanduensis TaxID=310781 RepID=A0A1G9WAS7_9ACTN|nr:DNA-binding transcriptional regulator, FadR family [Actinacidiphila guanduensis]
MDGKPVLAAGDVPAPRQQTAPPSGSYRPGYEVVAEHILQLIAELALQPGDRMPTENELASRLGTSRTVVREAIKILSAIGRVRAQKGRGLYVADDVGMLGSSRWASFFLPTDLDHVYRLFEFRRVQETAASRLAASRATPAELGAIETAADACREGFASGRWELFDRGDEDFHMSIAAASHNPFLVEAVREARRLQHQSSTIGMRGSVGGHAEEAVAEHAAIYQAIRSGDAEAAATAAGVHLDKTLEDYRREIQRRVFG